MPASGPDVVYVVGPGDKEHLRYSLRSLANVPHGRVWIAGTRPPWVRNITHVSVRQAKSKFENSTLNLVTACKQDGMSERVYLFNDDFYVMRSIPAIPVLHWGPASRVRRFYQGRGDYLRGLDATCALLREWGIDKPLSYELHVPFVFNRFRMVSVIERARRERYIKALFKRTLYANVYKIGGRQSRDAKSMNGSSFNRHALFLSSTNGRFRGRPIERFLQQQFPRKSIYEA